MPGEGRRNLWKGLAAGALGGFAGAFAMSKFHSLLPDTEPTPEENSEDSTVLAAGGISRSLFDYQLTKEQKKIAGPVVHYAFGASMGAVYGTLVEEQPCLQAGWGISFGIVLWLGAHVIAVPALGLSKPIVRSTLPAEGAEFGGHVVYGAVGEVVRRVVRAYALE